MQIGQDECEVISQAFSAGDVPQRQLIFLLPRSI